MNLKKYLSRRRRQQTGYAGFRKRMKRQSELGHCVMKCCAKSPPRSEEVLLKLRITEASQNIGDMQRIRRRVGTPWSLHRDRIHRVHMHHNLVTRAQQHITRQCSRIMTNSYHMTRDQQLRLPCLTMTGSRLPPSWMASNMMARIMLATSTSRIYSPTV